MAVDRVTRLVDPVSLLENREGRLGSRQQTRLADGAYRSRFDRVAGSVAAGGLAAAASVYSANLEVASSSERITVWAVSAAVVLLAAFVFRPWADPLGDDVRSGRVQHVTGMPVRVALAARRGAGFWRARYDVTIGAERFPVPGWLWSAVDDARTVTAYYLPRSRTLISIEAADERDERPFLPLPSRVLPVPSVRPLAIAAFGAVGLGLLARAILPPVEYLPDLPIGLLLVSIAVALSRPIGAHRITGER